ncbi:MAG: DUF489 family protein [Pseudomonadota bacterium]
MNSSTDKIGGSAGARFSEWEYRNIALAVVAQCAQLVHTLAFTGRADQRQIDACIAPLLVLNPNSTAEVYPEVNRFASGLDILQKSLTNAGAREYAEPIKYILGMTVLQQQLMRVPAMQALIRRRLPMLPMQQSFGNGLTENGLTENGLTAGGLTESALKEIGVSEGDDSSAASTQRIDEVPGFDEAFAARPTSQFNLNALAMLYQDTISKLTFRIHVKGNVEFLKDPKVADSIRALLLAGIRSSLLWHQLGGRRWHLIVYKKRIRDCATQVRRSLMTIH